MDALPPRLRTAAPVSWLAEQLPAGLDSRRRHVETCRAELVWARADWLKITGTAEGWEEAWLPHEQAAAWLIAVWGHVQPVEDRLRQGLERLSRQRTAGWDLASALGDVEAYRLELKSLWRCFATALAGYCSARAKVGCTEPASGWRRQNARIASNLRRKAS
jgi:hypothetical protein